MSAEIFLNLSVYLSKIFLLILEIFLGMLHYHTDDCHGHRQDKYCCHGHPHVDGKHHHKYTNQGRDRCDKLGDALVQTHLQSVHVVRYSGEDFSVCPALKIIQRHPVDLFGNIFSQIIGNIIGNSGHHIALDKGKAGAGYIQSHGPDQNLRNFPKINTAGSVYLCHKSVKQFCGSLSKYLWPYNVEHGTCNGKPKHQSKAEFISSHILEQSAHGSFEVLGFFAGMRSMSMAAHRASSSRLTHANSSSDNCDIAI